MQLEVKVVLKAAMEHPEVVVEWTMEEIVVDLLGDAVVTALHRKRRDAAQNYILGLIHETRLQVYKSNLENGVPVLGKPFVRFRMLALACEFAGVRVPGLKKSDCPSHKEGPADIVYSTMYVDKVNKRKNFVAARMKELSLEAAARELSLSDPVSDPLPGPAPASKKVKEKEAAGPAPKPLSGKVTAPEAAKKAPEPTSPAPLGDIELALSRWAPKADPAGKGKSKATVTSKSSMVELWEEVLGGSRATPEWPSWPGFPHHKCGRYDIPFPPSRDYEVCFRGPSAELGQYLPSSVDVNSRNVGTGLRKFVVLLVEPTAANELHKRDLLRSWTAVVAWVQHLEATGRDVPITHFLGEYMERLGDE